MKQTNYTLEVITIPILLFFFYIALIMNIPGRGEFCDQDAMAMLISILIFVLTCIIFLFRTVSQLLKKNDKKFRKLSLIIFISLLILSFGGLNKLIFTFYFGDLKNKAYSTKNQMVFIEFYENGTFFSEIFNYSCYEQITGTYEISNANLKLNYLKKSEYISPNYKLNGNTLISFDNKKDTLIIK